MKAAPMSSPGAGNVISLRDAVARMDAAEADKVAVANGDFSGLSMPILVACHDEDQLQEFIWRVGLVCSEVMRYRAGFRLWSGSAVHTLPENKILLLLPGWDEDFATREAVDLWVHGLDRHTVELRSPRPLSKGKRNLAGLLLILAAVWAVLVGGWMFFNR